MGNPLLRCVTGAVLGWSLPFTAAAQPGGEVPDVRSMTFVTGTCERMMIVSEDVSELCRAPVYSTSYHSGRVSFAFLATDRDSGTEFIVSFSGTEERRQGEVVQLLLDRITLAGNGDAGVSTTAAEGICEYGDPYAGPARISCAGRTQAGDFIGIFVSDGKTPTVQDF